MSLYCSSPPVMAVWEPWSFYFFINQIVICLIRFIWHRLLRHPEVIQIAKLFRFSKDHLDSFICIIICINLIGLAEIYICKNFLAAV